MKKTITAIIPTYNNAGFLPCVLDSILKSETVPGEILVIDDGSTDDTATLVKEYSDKYPFIRYIPKQHEGVSAARNLGLSLAESDYISFIDADDYIEPDMYSLMLSAIDDTEKRGFCCQGAICGYFTHKSGITTPYYDESLTVLSSGQILKAMFTDDNIKGFLPTRLFRTDLIKNISFDTDISKCEDLLFQSRLFSGKDVTFAYVAKPLYHYVQNEKSATVSLNFFENGTFSYKTAFERIDDIVGEDYVLSSYNSILEYSMYALLSEYKRKGRQKDLLVQIRQLQNELRKTAVSHKRPRRLAYQYAPILSSHFLR